MPKITLKKREARRQQILEAATRCFARDGFHRTTMEDIVRESRLSPGAIYCYFCGKNEIVEAIGDQRHRQESALLSNLLTSGDIAENLKQLAHDFFDMLQDAKEKERRKVTIQLWAESLRDKEIRKIVGRGLRQREALASALRSAQHQRQLRPDLDPDSLSRVMLAILQGFILQQAWEPGLNVAGFLETAIDLINASLPTTGAKPLARSGRERQAQR
jgi:AcrR family transcriptional regulator